MLILRDFSSNWNDRKFQNVQLSWGMEIPISSQLSQMSLTKLGFGLCPRLSFFKWAHSTSVFHQQNLCVYYTANSSHRLLLLHLTRTALFCRLETNGLFLNVRCHLLSLEYKWTKRHLQNTIYKQDQFLLTLYLLLRLHFSINNSIRLQPSAQSCI